MNGGNCQPCLERHNKLTPVSPKYASVQMCEGCATANNNIILPEPKPEPKPKPKYPSNVLTELELTVLQLRYGGLTQSQIARELNTTRSRVKDTCIRIYDKMGCDNTVMAVQLGIERGFLSPIYKWKVHRRNMAHVFVVWGLHPFWFGGTLTSKCAISAQ